MNEPSIWWDFDLTLDRRHYVQRLILAYRSTPTCAGTVRREDRRLAHRLYDQRTPLPLIEAAFSLAAMRRLYRPFEATPLLPVRSLHYFLPTMDEIRHHAIDPGYIDYAHWKASNAEQELDRIRRMLRQPPSPP